MVVREMKKIEAAEVYLCLVYRLEYSLLAVNESEKDAEEATLVAAESQQKDDEQQDADYTAEMKRDCILEGSAASNPEE